ncbi:MAG: hypothetical protein JWO78_1827 [Micavibrio sp.]|nr:hypothetical protein [Micavibrio sp.]
MRPPKWGRAETDHKRKQEKLSSHIFKLFNALSKWVVHGPDQDAADAVIPHRSNFIPTDALPPYIDRAYRRLGAGYDSPESIFRPELLNFSGLYNLRNMGLQEVYVRKLDRASPYEAKDILMTSGPLLDNPALAALPERRRLIAEITLAQMLYANGMQKDVYNFFCDYIRQCKPDAAFTNDEDARIKLITQSLLAGKNGASIKNMLPRKHITRDNAATQYHLRRNFMQAVADEIAKAHHHPSVPVIFDEFPRAIKHAGTYALRKSYVSGLRGTGAILVNATAEAINSVPRMINLVGHEMRHILDFKLSDHVRTSRLPIHHAGFIHGALIALNDAAYYSAPIGLENVLDKRDLSTRYNQYATQYMERAARNFGEKLEKSLSPALPAIFDPSLKITKMLSYSMH